MASIYTSAALLVVALCTPQLYDRYIGMSAQFANAPHKINKVSAFKSYDVKFAHQVRNCEDVVLDEDQGFALLSCNPTRDNWNPVMGVFRDDTSEGGIWFYDYSSSIPELVNIHKLSLLDYHGNLHPLGIEYYAPTETIYVVNHATIHPTIEVFKLYRNDMAATHIRTISHPQLNTANSIAAISDHELYVTNDHFWQAGKRPWLAQFETYLAPKWTSVVLVDTTKNQVAPVARVPFANGVTLVNSTFLAVASTTKPGVYTYTINPQTRSLRDGHYHRTPFLVDNLSADKEGNVIIAGHPHIFSFMDLIKRLPGCCNGRPCGEPGSAEYERTQHCENSAPSWVQSWNPATGVVKDLWVDDGKTYGTSTTGVRDSERKIGIVVGLYEKGILVWRE